MRLPKDVRFLEQRQRYELRCACEDCAHFLPDAERCAHEFPIEEHRIGVFADGVSPIVFCKEWASGP